MALPEPQEAIVEFNKKLTSETSLIRLKLQKPIDFRSGQFIQTITLLDNKKIRRSWSIASSPKNKEYIELLIKKYEKSLISPMLFKANQNDKITIQGPFGFFTLIKPYKKETVFIAAGVGVAPLRSMIYDLLENNIDTKVTLIFGFRTEKDYLLEDEWLNLEKKYENFKIIPVISRPEKNTEFFKGHVTDFIPKIIKKSDDTDFYICGPNIMIADTMKVLELIGINKKQIHIERWQ
ncbi:FAD-dependent oxidoreductase [Candidatus Woesearchaeota archaeon]|nr:FAD-dependent oxidoreductase [Candidatus Woesearchaeota archaeon]